MDTLWYTNIVHTLYFETIDVEEEEDCSKEIEIFTSFRQYELYKIAIKLSVKNIILCLVK